MCFAEGWPSGHARARRTPVTLRRCRCAPQPAPTHTSASKKPSEVWEQVYRHTEAWPCMPTSAPHIAGLERAQWTTESQKEKLGHAGRSKVFRRSMTLWPRLRDGLPSQLARRMGVGNGSLHLDAGRLACWLWRALHSSCRLLLLVYPIGTGRVFDLRESSLGPHITHSVAPPTTRRRYRKTNAHVVVVNRAVARPTAQLECGSSESPLKPPSGAGLSPVTVFIGHASCRLSLHASNHVLARG